MDVPAVAPAKVSKWPTASVPTGVPVTVNVAVPEATEPVKLAAPVPSGQKAPAGHAVPVVAPCAQKVPAAQGLDVAARLPKATQKPGAHWLVEPVGATAVPGGQK